MLHHTRQNQEPVVDRVERPCSGDWEFQAISSFSVGGTASYPSGEFFEQEAADQCDQRYEFYRYPGPETWKVYGTGKCCACRRAAKPSRGAVAVAFDLHGH